MEIEKRIQYCPDTSGDCTHRCARIRLLVCQIRPPSLQSIILSTAPLLQERPPRCKHYLMLYPFCISTSVRSHTRARVSIPASATRYGWLPHRCPFPELRLLTQTYLVSLSHVSMTLNQRPVYKIYIERPETLHGAGSFEDPVYWCLLDRSHE
jgi:hypothetical protein